MSIDQALKLKIGDVVYCPADRGDSAYRGKVHVTPINPTICTNIYNVKYIWLNVYHGGVVTVWPSNRLG